GITGELSGQLIARILADGFAEDELTSRWQADLRYVGQSHTITVPLGRAELAGLEGARLRFIAEHRKRYGHASDTAPVELVNLRLKISRQRAEFASLKEAASNSEPRPVATRKIWLDEHNETECPVYSREDLPSGWKATGPLVIEQF